jgi:hypothetical protein
LGLPLLQDPNRFVVFYVTLPIFGRITELKLQECEASYKEFIETYVKHSHRTHIKGKPRIETLWLGLRHNYTMLSLFRPIDLKEGIKGTFDLIGKSYQSFSESAIVGYVETPTFIMPPR